MWDGVNTLTFDCYGTLIDWQLGIETAFREVFGDISHLSPKALLDIYMEEEAVVESQTYRRYREVVVEAFGRVAKRLKVDIPTSRVDQLPELVPMWTPFSDTNEALKRLQAKFRLGILSNIDRELFDSTTEHFDVAFDFVITAEDVRSYKPSHGHFERLLAAHGPKESIVHVAQSLMHDGVPANELGIAYVWINRYNHDNDRQVTMLDQYPTLRALADAIA